jgi:hypothetical protein
LKKKFDEKGISVSIEGLTVIGESINNSTHMMFKKEKSLINVIQIFSIRESSNIVTGKEILTLPAFL